MKQVLAQFMNVNMSTEFVGKWNSSQADLASSPQTSLSRKHSVSVSPTPTSPPTTNQHNTPSASSSQATQVFSAEGHSPSKRLKCIKDNIDESMEKVRKGNVVQ